MDGRLHAVEKDSGQLPLRPYFPTCPRGIEHGKRRRPPRDNEQIAIYFSPIEPLKMRIQA